MIENLQNSTAYIYIAAGLIKAISNLPITKKSVKEILSLECQNTSQPD